MSTKYIAAPHEVTCTQNSDGSFFVESPACGKVLIAADVFSKFFRQPIQDQRAEAAVAQILDSASIDEDMRSNILNSFRGSNPFSFVRHLQTLGINEKVGSQLLKAKLSTGNGLNR